MFVLTPAALCVEDELGISYSFELLKRVKTGVAEQLIQYWSQRLIERERVEDAIAAIEAFMAAHEPRAPGEKVGTGFSQKPTRNKESRSSGDSS